MTLNWKRALAILAVIASLPPIALLYLSGLSWLYDQLPQLVHLRILLCIRWIGKALPIVLQPGVTWPLAIAVVLWILRVPIASFINRMKHVKAFGTEWSDKAEVTEPFQPPPGSLSPAAPAPQPTEPKVVK